MKITEPERGREPTSRAPSGESANPNRPPVAEDAAVTTPLERVTTCMAPDSLAT